MSSGILRQEASLSEGGIIDEKGAVDRQLEATKAAVHQSQNGERYYRYEYSAAYTKEIFELKPGMEEEFKRQVGAALIFHGANQYEEERILSLFGDTLQICSMFRFVDTNEPFGGMYQYCLKPLANDTKEFYFWDLTNCQKDWRLYINRTMFRDDVLLVMVLRHEIDHLVYHLLAILRQYKNCRQFAQVVHKNPLYKKKTEFFAFYNATNLAIIKKGAGFEIDWETIMQLHTGSHIADSGDISEDYDGVVNYTKDIFSGRNHFYNLLHAHFGTNRNSNNEYGAINPDGMYIFEVFCGKAIPDGVKATKTERELEIFLSFLASLRRNYDEGGSLNTFIQRLFNVSPEVYATEAYTVFIRHMQAVL